MEKSYGLAIGTLWALTHLLRIQINRGHVSPQEVDEIYGSLIEGVQGGDPQVATLVETRLEGVFADMRRKAEQLYKG